MELVRARAQTEPDRTAFEFVERDRTVRHLSHRALDDAARGFAGALAEHARPGDRALLLCPPGLDYVVAVLGCQRAGVWPVPALPPTSARHLPRLDAIARDATPTVVIADRPRELPAPLAQVRFLAAGARAPAASDLAAPTPDDVALVQYTSGSTGSPRGVVLTHGQIVANLEMIARAFGLTETDRGVLWLPPFHDMGLIGGVFTPLHVGFPMRLMSPVAFLADPLGWLEQISATGATIAGGPNFGYEHCVDRLRRRGARALDLTRWQIAFTGAEPIRARTLARFADAFAPAGFSARAWYPCYGLAEATLIVSGAARGAGATLGDGPDGQRLVGCGRPAPGLTVRVVDPTNDTPVGPREVGEIRVSGPSVARGYLGGDDARFTAAVAGDHRPYLATGDLGFLDEHGELFVCGRRSDLVIVRGRNVYPHDVEAAAEGALAQAGIATAFGVERDGEEGLVVVREVARVDGEDVPRALAAVRKAVLEAVDVQAAEVLFTKPGVLPRTSSGKVRRREARRMWEAGELPVLARSRAGEDHPAAGLRALVADVVGLPIEAVRADEPAVSAGLDSFGATIVAARAEQELGLVVEPVALLGGESLEQVERTSTAAAAAPAVAPSDGSPGELPLSVGQQAIWHHEQLGRGCGYNLPIAVDLPGDVDASVLARRLEALGARHAALRTQFEDGLRQRVLDAAACPLVLERRPVASAALAEALAAEAAVPLAPSEGRVVRAVLFEPSGAGRVLLLVVHHLVADAWSLGLLLRELAGGDPAPTTSFAGVVAEEARFLASPAAAALLDAWAARLDGAPRVLELPRDRPRPPRPVFDGDAVPFAIDAPTTDAIRALARAEQTTPFAVVAAAVAGTLARLSGADEVVLGTPAARRASRARRAVVGLVMNPVVLRIAVDPAASFRALVRGAAQALTWARTAEEIPFASVVERVGRAGASSTPPIFQTLLAWQRDDAALPGGWTLRPMPQPGSPVDLALDVRDDGVALTGWVRYATTLFDRDTATGVAEVLRALLTHAPAAPDRALAAVPLAAASAWGRGGELPPEVPDVVDAFRRQVTAHGERVAVEAGAQRLTYRELDTHAAGLAQRIVAEGHGPVGLLLDRSTDVVVGTLAALMAGAPFVPLDPELPEVRLRAMLEDAGARTTVASATLRGRVPAGVRVIDATGEPPAHPWATLPAARSDGLAYVMFTSGSTGRPKGVAIERRALAAFLSAFAALEPLALDGRSAVLALTSTSFDISLLELLLPLVVGARVTVAPRGAAADPEEVLRLIARAGVTHLQATPSTLAGLCDAGFDARAVAVLCGGEAAPPGLFARLRARCRRVWNVYGPTETTIWSTIAAVEDDRDPSLGAPLAGEVVHVLDGALRPVPLGVEGELFVAGVGVARGYVGDPALTAARFLPDPSANVGGARLYRTGDRARWRADGRLEFRGRVDGQVKVRGHRIELEEIEHVLGRHPDVARAVAAAVGEGADRRLIAAIEPRPGRTVTWEALTEHLRAAVPGYAIPSAFHLVDQMPVTSRGKVDRAAIAKAPTLTPHAARAAPHSETERALAAIWRDLLRVDVHHADDDFFALGGHSLLIQRVVARVREHLGKRLVVADVFTNPTLAALARTIDQAPPDVMPTPPGGDVAALLDVQRRIWAAETLAPGHTPRVVLGVRVDGPLDPGALEEAVAVVVARHEELRARFPSDGGRPVRRVEPRVTVALPVLSSHAPPASLVAELAAAPFDLARGPLVRAALWRLGPDDHVFAVVLHHLVCDGAAAAVLLAELSAIYAARAAGAPLPALPPAVGHADVGARPAPRRATTTSTSSPAAPCGVERARLDAEVTAAVRRLARARAVTPFVLVGAALVDALRRQTGATRLVLGVDVDLREAALERAIVPLVEQVTLVIEAAAPTFPALIDAVRGALHAALVDTRAAERFDVKLAYQPMAEEALSLGATRLTRLERPAMDQAEHVVLFAFEARDALVLELHHRADVWPREAAAHLLRAIVAALEQAARPAPERPRFSRRVVKGLERADRELATVNPDGAGDELAAWITRHRDGLAARLAEDGALWFRGFACVDPAALERAVAAAGGARYETREHPRTRLGGSVFTPVEYPSREFLMWHNEDSFQPTWPARLWFACARPADEGGETVVADGAAILDHVRAIDPRLLDGLTYVRRYGERLGRDWRLIFASDDRDVVEARLRAQGLTGSWDGDVLTTRASRPSVKRHPSTGVACWIGQLLHFHPAALPPATRAELRTLYGSDAWLRDCRHADGSPIDDRVVERVVAAYRTIERACRWQAGDVLLVDNVRAAHGRRAYRGERRLLVMLTEPLEHDR